MCTIREGIAGDYKGTRGEVREIAYGVTENLVNNIGDLIKSL